MDTQRVILYGALGIVIYFLWSAWQKDYPSTPPAQTTQVSQVQAHTEDEQLLPSISSQSREQADLPNVSQNHGSSSRQQGHVIHVKTDVLSLTIDLKQGNVIQAKLLEYPESLSNDTPFELLSDDPAQRYIAKSQLLRLDNERVSEVDAHYTTTATHYEIQPGQEQLVIPLVATTNDGLQIKKEFVLERGGYLVDVRYQLRNNGSETWSGYMNTQLLRTQPVSDKNNLLPGSNSYTGASYSNPGQHRYKKVTFKDMSKGNLDAKATGGWIAMQQHYFLTAWVPNQDVSGRFYTRSFNGNYVIGSLSPTIELSPGQSDSVNARLYLGPEKTSLLKGIAPGLDLTVDYGWLWFISSVLFSVMKAIYSVVGNWGWSIVLVTFLIKLAFFRLSATSYKSMANMRKLQPKMQALRERYGDDKAKLSQATMELYKKEKLNPLGGCLPILVQIPVFIALYWVLIESVELRQAPFIFWIKDLATADPYHVLPLIMGVTMLIQQKLNPAPPDPMQAKVMMFLPVVFTALFWNFPSGLVLYWVVQNVLSILQQWFITRRYDDKFTNGKKLAST